jgi:ribose/xylose/arabinose/galactoside ABC-type transport system permease subunit
VKKNLEPSGMGQRIFGALALVLGVAFGAHEAWLLLRPLIPTLIVLLFLFGIFTVLFRGRR